MKVPPFCKRCKGHGELACVVRSFQSSKYDGHPWDREVDESKDAKLDVIRPEICPVCNGTGHEKEA